MFYKILMDIININVGQCGRRIGDVLMRRIYSDHFSQQQPIGNHSTFFSESKKKHYARSIFLDMDTNQDVQRLSRSSSIYKQNNFLRHKQSCQSNYGVAMYQSGNFNSEAQQLIRKQFELSQSVSGIILNSSYSGGAGSGLTGMVQLMREMNLKKMLQTFRLMPEFQLYAHPVQVYNTTFSIHHQVEQTDMSLMFDNGTIHKSLLQDNIFTPTFEHLNNEIGQAIADSTIPYRFKGQLNTSQRKIASNLIMFPRMHFFSFSRCGSNTVNPLLSGLSLQNFLITNYFQNSLSSSQSKIFTVYAGIRSNRLCESDISRTVKKQFFSKNLLFQEWIQDNVHISLHEPIRGKENASVFVSSRHFCSYLRKIAELFAGSFRRKAFIHRYVEAGMDQMQFTQAESNMNDLMSEYQPHLNFDYEDLVDDQQNIQ